MPEYNFDEYIDRSGTSSLKWDLYKPRGIEPFWVADMDFKSADPIVDALTDRVAHGVFGYTLCPEELEQTVVRRLKMRYGWKIEKEWIVWIPGIVPALEVVCRAFAEQGDDVMTTTPIYPPFLSAPKHSGCETITASFEVVDGQWTLDIAALEAVVTDKTRVFLLCNPHNPTGRVLTRDELLEISAFCKRHDLVICSDEIHCELILDEDKKHIPTATLSDDVATKTITLMAPSKTFNIAGLGCSFAIISDRKLRAAFQRTAYGIVPYINTLGYTAALAAYRDSSDWHEQLLIYLRGNRDYLQKEVNSIGGLAVQHIESTYLAWIDCRSLSCDSAVELFESFNVGLSNGREFGMPGFVRFNFGCSRERIEWAVDRMKEAVESL